MRQKRILYLDIARVIAVLWIVGYYHLRVYVGPSYYIREGSVSFYGDKIIIIIMLSLFMFLSGFFMSSYTFDNFKRDSWTFYQKRLKRFYVLYAISAVLLYLIGWNNGIGRLLTTLTATSSYILPQPSTLWFLSMLASFYFLTPFIMKKRSLSVMTMLYVIFALLYLLNPIDSRIFWCFPCYCVGILIGRHSKYMDILSSMMVGMVSFVLLSFQFVFLFYYSEELPYFKYTTIPTGIVFVLFLSKQIGMIPNVDEIIMVISYGSMCAYLFHRAIYAFLMVIYNWLGLDYPYWFSLVVFCPICFYISYYIQKWYDHYSRYFYSFFQ